VSEGPPTLSDPPEPPTTAVPPEPPRTGWLDRALSWSGANTTRGIAVALLAPIAGLPIALSCLAVPVVGQWLCIAFAGAPGLTQLVWIVPLDRWAAHRGRSEFRKGLWIGASVVFLINSTCWGLVTNWGRK